MVPKLTAPKRRNNKNKLLRLPPLDGQMWWGISSMDGTHRRYLRRRRESDFKILQYFYLILHKMFLTFLFPRPLNFAHSKRQVTQFIYGWSWRLTHQQPNSNKFLVFEITLIILLDYSKILSLFKTLYGTTNKRG